MRYATACESCEPPSISGTAASQAALRLTARTLLAAEERHQPGERRGRRLRPGSRALTLALGADGRAHLLAMGLLLGHRRLVRRRLVSSFRVLPRRPAAAHTPPPPPPPPPPP